MNRDHIQEEVAHLAQTPDLLACAVVEASTGMIFVWQSADPALEITIEAATDYWRLCQRNAERAGQFGKLQTISVQYEAGLVNLLPCGPDMVFVTVAKQMFTGWREWPRQVARVAKLLS